MTNDRCGRRFCKRRKTSAERSYGGARSNTTTLAPADEIKSAMPSPSSDGSKPKDFRWWRSNIIENRSMTSRFQRTNATSMCVFMRRYSAAAVEGNLSVRLRIFRCRYTHRSREHEPENTTLHLSSNSDTGCKCLLVTLTVFRLGVVTMRVF